MRLLGRDPLDLDGIHAAMNRAIAPSFSTGQPICKAGVDLALFDLTGKLLKQSAAQRWDRKGLSGSVLKQPFEVKNGELAVPTGHGLGVEVDEAKLREMSVRDL